NQHALDFARQVISTLASQLQKEARSANLDVCVDGGWHVFANDRQTTPATASGATLWDEQADLKVLVRATATVQAGSGGTAAFLVLSERLPAADELAQVLHHVWQRTEITRLCFVHSR